MITDKYNPAAIHTKGSIHIGRNPASAKATIKGNGIIMATSVKLLATSNKTTINAIINKPNIIGLPNNETSRRFTTVSIEVKLLNQSHPSYTL